MTSSVRNLNDDDRVRKANRNLRLGVVTAFPPSKGSLTEYGFHLVTQLAAQPDVEHIVLHADRTSDGRNTEVLGVDVDQCWEMNRLGNIFSIVRSIRRERPDAVLFNIQFASFGDTKIAGGLGLLTPWLVRFLGTPVVVLLHNLADNVDMRDAGFAGSPISAWLMQRAGRLLTWALLRANFVAVTIPRYVEFLQESYQAKNVLLAPHGSFSELSEPVFGPIEGPRKILAFGKWGTYKTVDGLIEAFMELQKRGYSDIELVIAGSD
ncbi:MAG: hypothetical protein ACRCSF_07520, partial [Mycobacteriaceae bacterium]